MFNPYQQSIQLFPYLNANTRRSVSILTIIALGRLLKGYNPLTRNQCVQVNTIEPNEMKVERVEMLNKGVQTENSILSYDHYEVVDTLNNLFSVGEKYNIKNMESKKYIELNLHKYKYLQLNSKIISYFFKRYYGYTIDRQRFQNLGYYIKCFKDAYKPLPIPDMNTIKTFEYIYDIFMKYNSEICH